jgi:hypothetical protein
MYTGENNRVLAVETGVVTEVGWETLAMKMQASDTESRLLRPINNALGYMRI